MELADKRAERILGALARGTVTDYSVPKIARNASVFIDAIGQLNILTEFGLLLIDEEDLNVIDSEDV